MVESARHLLAALCADLRLLWTQAGGPSLRALGGALPLSKSQVGAILNGRIRRPPDWRVVSGHAESGIGYPAGRRPPRPQSGSDVVAGQILERSRHLTALRDALATVRGGSGGVLVLLSVRYR